MSLSNIFDIAGSAMSAQSVRLNTTASNMANADSVSSSYGETYRARKAVFELGRQDELQPGVPLGTQAGQGLRLPELLKVTRRYARNTTLITRWQMKRDMFLSQCKCG